MDRIRGEQDPGLRTCVVERWPLAYALGADAALDRPGHVRAGSSLAWLGGRLVVVQDDTCFFGFVDPKTHRVDALPLPAGHGGLRQFDERRGNKKHKLDLEASVALQHVDRTVLLALGSGSTPARERVVWLESLDSAPRVVGAGALYRNLRERTEFAGSELNIEGAVALGHDVLLFQRGNGAPRGSLAPVDATCALGARDLADYLAAPERGTPPTLRDVTQFALGEIDGARLTFTDATVVGDQIVFASAAEESPDAVQDGPVRGVGLGILANRRARWCVLLDEQGRKVTDKVEGLAPVPGDPARLWAVVDRDDPAVPAELLLVALQGF